MRFSLKMLLSSSLSCISILHYQLFCNWRVSRRLLERLSVCTVPKTIWFTGAWILNLLSICSEAWIIRNKTLHHMLGMHMHVYLFLYWVLPWHLQPKSNASLTQEQCFVNRGALFLAWTTNETLFPPAAFAAPWTDRSADTGTWPTFMNFEQASSS